MAGRRQDPQTEEADRFEDLYAQLEEIARRLEVGQLGLEESISMYERGASLVERLRGILDDADRRVKAVRERLNGSPARAEGQGGQEAGG